MDTPDPQVYGRWDKHLECRVHHAKKEKETLALLQTDEGSWESGEGILSVHRGDVKRET